jgi:predicted RNA-binding protein with PUA-like domain
VARTRLGSKMAKTKSAGGTSSTTKTKALGKAATKPSNANNTAGKKKSAPAKKAAGAKAKPAARNVSPRPAGRKRAYWLFKSEPEKFSWDDLKAKGAAGEEWDGVRNYLARNNMRAMKLGDLGFFYRSNAGKDIVGIVEVCALAHPDSTTDDERWECVDVRAVCEVPKPVTLADVKSTPALNKMALVTSMRLSVQPVTADEWKVVCKMGGLDPKRIGK